MRYIYHKYCLLVCDLLFHSVSMTLDEQKFLKCIYRFYNVYFFLVGLVLSRSHLSNFYLIAKILPYALFQYRMKVEKAYNFLVMKLTLSLQTPWVSEPPDDTLKAYTMYLCGFFFPICFISSIKISQLWFWMFFRLGLSDFSSCILKLYFDHAHLGFLRFLMNWSFCMSRFISGNALCLEG